MTTEAPTGYTRMQIVLHWAVVVLVLVQFLIAPAMTAMAEAMFKGEPLPVNPLGYLHMAIGFVILVLAAWRVGMRFAYGAPPLTFEPKTPEQELLVFVSRELAFFLYFTLFALPVIGAIGWFYQSPVAAATHANMKVLLIAVVVVHVAIVLFHQFGLRDGAFDRMRRPRQD